eukprot:TRINITY_DN4842_c0_g1_i1.p1 TRINITY_DN4842_c0_g1~~TRINITY_DN4842_c0_g1_i1.p1  ORF type:complete len:179 (-),score=12.84 TRINITY_DN4842_c0_g1_i1:107-643(-)
MAQPVARAATISAQGISVPRWWKWALPAAGSVAALCAGTLGWYHLVQKHWAIQTAFGESMQPTFAPGSRFLFERFSWRHSVPLFQRRLKQGDVVAFRSPLNAKDMYLKRVAAMEGDWVDGAKVPPGHIYVLGDNLDKSRDSRIYGCVPINLVEYRAVVRVWPWPKWAYDPQRIASSGK